MYENYRIRTCNILYYLEDDAIHVIEIKTENSGMTQGDLIKRRKINYHDIHFMKKKKKNINFIIIQLMVELKLVK